MKYHRTLVPCLMVATAMLGPSRAFATTSHVIAAFDEAVRHSLPQTIHISTRQTLGRGAPAGSTLTITDTLDVDVRFPDGTGAQTYLATFDGAPAVVTRSTDHLDVTVTGADGIAITGYEMSSNAPHRIAEPHAGPARGLAPAAKRTSLAPARAGAARAGNDYSLLSPNEAPPTLNLWIFLHDDTAAVSRRHIHAGYVAWWLADLKRFVPRHRFRVNYIDRREGMTDIVYGDRNAAITTWTKAAQGYEMRANLPYAPGRYEHKFMLVTRDRVAPSTNGVAWHGGDQAMASLAGPWSIVAHEFGHTLTAVHDDSALWWSYVWPCATNLYPTHFGVTTNCYRYTQANEQLIAGYLSRKDDSPRPMASAGATLTMVE